MKKIVIAALSIIIMANMATTVFATESDKSIDIGNEIIKIGYLKNYGIIDEPIIRGSRGFGFEFFNEISKYTNYKYEYIEVEWDEGLEKLKTGEIDIFGPADKTAERELIYEFIPKPFGYEDIAIYSLEDFNYNFGDKESIDGTKIGVTKGIAFQDELEDYIANNNLDIEIIHIDDNDFATHIKNGEIDLCLSGALYNQKGMEIVDIIDSKPFYFMTTKGNTELVDEISNALNQIEKTKKGYMYTLYNKYYGNVPYANQTLTEEEIAALSAKSVYTVGYHCDWRPLSYTDKDGIPKGFAIDTMNEFAKQLGIEIEYIPLHGEESYDISKLDFNLCMGEDECINHGQLSEPYSYLDTAVLTAEGVETRADIKHIVAMDYSTLEIEKYLDVYSSAKIHFAHSGAENIQIIKDYEVDCIIALEPKIQMMLNNEPNNDYEVTFIDSNTPLGIAVSHDLPHEVYTALDKVIIGMDKTLVGKNIAKSLSELQTDVDLAVFLSEYGILITSIIIFLIFSLVIIYLRLVIRNGKKLKNLVEVDQVTGLMTMTKMMPEMMKLLANANPKEYYILSFDIDNFRIINQTYGFKKGNELLGSIANSMRKYASEDALMCRLSDDIFVIFGKSVDVSKFNVEDPLFSQERCNEIIEKTGINSVLHFSAGCYVIENALVSIEKVIDNVRKARNISKLKYGNCVTFYTEEIKLQTEKENEINASAEKAIEHKEFFVVVQPKVELETGKLIGGEVLVRWKKADGTFIYPDEFIPLFERNSFIVELDRYVFEETCKFVKNAGINLPHLSVNMSVMTALSEDVIEKYREILDKYDLKPEQFEIELTESALEFDFEKVRKISVKIKELGFSLSLDDFGKGASSLTRINDLDVDVIKLDRGFITNNINQQKGNSVVANAITLANQLGVRTLAEGIETKEQLDMLLEFGCELGQGYYFDKPLSTQGFLDKAIIDSQKLYPKAMKSKEKIKKYLSDFESLPYGIAITKNDQYFTVIKANEQFYDIIGHTKAELEEKHKNRLTNILVDNLYSVVEEQDTTKDYDIEWDLRIKTANGDDIWVTDYVHYDAAEDIFFITFMDSTDKMIFNSEKLSFIAYQAQKEALLYMNALTSDYIVVSDIETEDVVFVNENTMKVLGFSCEDDWIGKKYHEVTYGKSTPMYQEYYNTVLEKGYGSRDYYNEHLDMYLHNENKIITVMGKKMRLNIVTDITAKKKQERENNIQITLKECIEYLYTNTTTSVANVFQNMLERLRIFYGADRAYYFRFSEEQGIAINSYEVVRNGVKPQIQDLQSLSFGVIQVIHEGFEQENALCIDGEWLLLHKANEELIKLFDDGNITLAVLASVQDEEGNIVGLIGVDNPKENGTSTELMTLLSRYVWMFINNMDKKTFEKEALQAEEKSFVSIIKEKDKLLKGLENPNKNITEVL